MAQTIKGITVEIGGNTTNLVKSLNDVNSKTRDLQKELKGVNSLLKMDPSNVTLLKQKQDILNESISNTREKLERLKNAQAQVQAQFEKGDIGVEQYRDFQREIISTEQKLKSLEDQHKQFGTVGAQQIAVAGGKFQEIGSSVENAGKKMLGATAVIGGLGAAAIKVGTSFDDNMKQVAATMGITVDEIEKGSKSYQILEEAAKKAGETTKFSASESAEALNYLALAGYDAEKAAATLPKVLNLAAAGGLDLATASDMVTDAMAALGLETQDLDKYIDEMAKTSQKSNTSVAQLGEATLTSAGAVKMAGMSLETMNAELGILANNGIKGAEGGTHLRNIILSLTSPTDAASKALNNLGISVLDSQGNVRDLNDIMSDFDSKLSGLSDGEKTEIISTIFNKTDISAVNALIKGSGEEFSNLKAQIQDSNGAAKNMADTMNSSLGGQLTLLTSQLEGIANKVVSILMPVLQELMTKISGLLTWISNLSPTTQKVIVIILGMVAVLGPLLIFIGKIITAVGTIMSLAPTLAGIIGAVKTAVIALNAVLLANPIGLIIAAIVALIAIFVTLYNKCEWFRDGVNKIIESIKNLVLSGIQFITNLFNSVVDFFKNNWQSLLLLIVNPFAGAFKLLYDNCEGFRNFVDNLLQNIKNLIDTAWSNIVNFFTQSIPNFINSIVSWISQLPSNIWNCLVNVIQKVVEFGVNMAQKGLEAGKNLADSVKNAISGLPGEMLNFGKDAIQGFINGIKGMISKVGDAAKSVANKIKDFLHFSRPDEGPLREYEKWMPDMIQGLAKSLTQASPQLIKQIEELSKEAADAMNPINDIAASNKLRINDVDYYNPNDVRMLSGKSNTPQNEVSNVSTNNISKDTYNFYANKDLSPSETVRELRKQKQFDKLLS